MDCVRRPSSGNSAREGVCVCAEPGIRTARRHARWALTRTRQVERQSHHVALRPQHIARDGIDVELVGSSAGRGDSHLVRDEKGARYPRSPSDRRRLAWPSVAIEIASMAGSSWPSSDSHVHMVPASREVDRQSGGAGTGLAGSVPGKRQPEQRKGERGSNAPQHRYCAPRRQRAGRWRTLADQTLSPSECGGLRQCPPGKRLPVKPEMTVRLRAVCLRASRGATRLVRRLPDSVTSDLGSGR
jgi:hypothetical protein